MSFPSDAKSSDRKHTVLVTGAAGFIGSHVAESLVQAGHSVLGLDDLSGGFEDNVPAGVTFVRGSILDTELLEKLFRENQFRYVFHLAAYAAEGLSHFIRRFNYNNNVLGSIGLINQAIRYDVRCFVFTSSIAVYGDCTGKVTEQMVPTPIDPYGIAKYTVEMDLHAARSMFGLRSIIFRPHNVYGERQHIGDRYRNVVGIFINQLLRNQPMTIFGDGTQTRAFTHISDVSEVIARSIDLPEAYDRTFNIGADESTTVGQLASMVANALDRPMNVQHLQVRNEAHCAVADHSLIAKVFGYQPRVPLHEGLQRMAAWAQKVGPREPSPLAQVEVEKNLPPSWNPTRT